MSAWRPTSAPATLVAAAALRAGAAAGLAVEIRGAYRAEQPKRRKETSSKFEYAFQKRDLK